MLQVAVEARTPRGRWLQDRRARITCPYGKRGWWQLGTHPGVDIAVPGVTRVTVVWALPHPGKVIQIGGCGEPYGQHVLIRSRAGQVWLFAHLSRIDVVRGQRVANGDTIGLTGATGTKGGGDHLHLERSRRSVWQYGDVRKPFVYDY